MERLTFEGNFCNIAQCSSMPGGSFCENGNCSQRKIWERLKAYEATGFAPQEIKSLKGEWNVARKLADDYRSLGTIEDLTALMQAKREGRLVELPCKVGDRAFVLDSEDKDGGDDCIFEGVIVAINIGVDGTTVSVGDMVYHCWFSETERRVEDLHTDWYLSEDEAEAALAAQEGGSHETDTV